MLSALRIGRLYPPGDTPDTNFCQGHSPAERFKSMKNPNDPIGIRTRDLPAYGALPQSTEPQSTSEYTVTFLNIVLPSVLLTQPNNCRSGYMNQKVRLRAHSHVNVSSCPVSSGQESSHPIETSLGCLRFL